jgi:tetratricopeptide (TPR) repeat protein
MLSRLSSTSTPRLLRCRPALGVLSHVKSTRQSSTSSKSPEPYRAEPDSDFLDYGFAKHTQSSVNALGRLFKYTFFGVIIGGSTAWTAYEATHMYVEHMELAPETDASARQWEWDREVERWAGGSTGGTDGALGLTGTHAIRAAWIAQHWGTGGEAGAVMSSGAFSGRARTAGGLNVIDARLEYSQDLLTIAIKRAMEPKRKSRVHPATAPILMYRHANMLELMGSRDALFEARDEIEHVWKDWEDVESIDRARIALKLGDLNGRLGDAEDALNWWSRAISLAQGSRGDAATAPSTPTVPDSVPLSPFAQRTLASTLVSLSAFYSTSGRLQDAKAMQSSAIELLASSRSPVNVQVAPPAESLHSLLLLHRSALLRVHHAEVQYALRSPISESISELRTAADSSERVALLLAGLPLMHPDAPGSGIPHPPASEHPPAKRFTGGAKSLRRPATALLRDARRSAAEAWTLIGVLTEEEGRPDAKEKALEHYERALGWAGVKADRAGNIGQAGEGVLEAEYQVLWKKYVRTREAVRQTAGKGA